jgi:hypothetical protein
MIIPVKDYKISQFTSQQNNKPIHFLSSTKIKQCIYNVNNQMLSKDIILTTCTEKDYIIAFYNIEIINKVKEDSKHPYFINTVEISEMLNYCTKYKHNLLMFDDKNKTWHKIDPENNTTSLHFIEFKYDRSES